MKNTMLKKMGLIVLLIMSQGLFSDEEICKENSGKSLKSTSNYKKYLENTTWIVPPSTLLAYEYVSGTSTPVNDQTVWVINSYNMGYFFGSSYTCINGSIFSQMNLVGSVTPFGDVYITFFPLSGVDESTDVVSGIGKFIKSDNIYYFVMQMNSASNSTQGLAHWSYMISVKPTDYYYQHLPGENISVPQFLAQF